jgi:hypothetical protein
VCVNRLLRCGAMYIGNKFLMIRRRRQQVSPKRRCISFKLKGVRPQKTVIFILVVKAVRMSNFAMFGLIFMSIKFMFLDQTQDFADVGLVKLFFFINLQNNRCLRTLCCCCVISLHLLVHYIHLASFFSPTGDYALLS